jgi:hypothetical protein
LSPKVGKSTRIEEARSVMADIDFVLVNIEEDADRLALQYLGAAALVNWDALPISARMMLFEGAQKIGGLEPATGLAQSLTVLLKRHGKIGI